MSIFLGKKGQGLIAAIALILILSVFGLFIASLLSTQTGQTVTEKVQSAQALYITKAGVQWYLEQLARSTNWVGQTDVLGKPFAGGTFDVTVNQSARFSTSIQFTVTGRVTGFDGRSRERFVTVTAKKLPSAFRFALYWGTQLTGNPVFNITQTSRVIGDYWSRGTTQVSANSSITNGTAYYAQGQDVRGTGFTKKAIPFPPAMPVFTSTFYSNLMTGFDAKIAQVATHTVGAVDLTMNTDLVVPANTVVSLYRDINTNGRNIILNNNSVLNCRNIVMQGASRIQGSNFTINCNQDFAMQATAQIQANNFTINCNRYFYTYGNNLISGSGSIVTLVNARLQSQNGAAGVLTVTPSASTHIDFLSRQSVTVNRSNAANSSVTMNPGVRFYSQCQPANNQFSVSLQNANTVIDGALLIGRRQITITNGAKLTNSTLFVTSFSATSNYININGSGTAVTGNVISLGRSNPSLYIFNNASFTGLAYHLGGATGGAQLQNSTIVGSVVASGFNGNRISNTAITYQPFDVAALPPEGFEGYVMVTENSWDVL